MKCRVFCNYTTISPKKVVNTDFSQQADTERENLRFLGFARKFVVTDPDTALRPKCNYGVWLGSVYVKIINNSLTGVDLADGMLFAVVVPSCDGESNEASTFTATAGRACRVER